MRGTRAIYAATAAVLLVIGALSVVIYRATERDVVESFSAQQLAVVRTVSVALGTEVKALALSLRQLNTLPSVQVLDVDYTGQRVRDAFESDTTGIIARIVRIDADERRYTWTTRGELVENSAPSAIDSETWRWFADRANQGNARMGPIWWGSASLGADPSTPRDRDSASPGPGGDAPQLRALVMPVWQVASAGPQSVPPNSFNGVLAFVIDAERLMRVYARPAARGSTGDMLTLDLGDGAPIQFGLPGAPADTTVEPLPAEIRSEPEGTRVAGGEVWAWSRVPVPDGSWTVMTSTPYSVAAARFRDRGRRQLAMVAVLLVLVPLVGWLLVRRERDAEEERRVLELQLSQAQKMDAIGKLAGGIAHDFNNLLTAILGYVSLILEDVPPGTPVYEEASQIRRAAENAAALTQKLLAFSRRQVLQPQAINLATLLKETLVFITRLVGEHIRIVPELQPDLWPVIADPIQVEQAIINLAINARDAMPDGGTLEIVARNAPRPQGDRRADHIVQPGDYVQIVVRDTGVGMDEATRARMFEPFFTTKPKGKGTGLGLSTVYGIVKQSGGYINVSSTPDAGTTIELLLPRAPAEVAAAPTPARAAEPASHGTETVLLVEDEESVRELARTTLERHGYHVLTAPGPLDALRIAHDFRERISLLLTDVVMPGMQGPELATELRLMRPGVRVLFMSGYAAEAMTSDTLKDAALLQKPFSPAVLSRAVRLVLDKE